MEADKKRGTIIFKNSREATGAALALIEGMGRFWDHGASRHNFFVEVKAASTYGWKEWRTIGRPDATCATYHLEEGDWHVITLFRHMGNNLETLLHELCHVGRSKEGNGGHGRAFFRRLKSLEKRFCRMFLQGEDEDFRGMVMRTLKERRVRCQQTLKEEEIMEPTKCKPTASIGLLGAKR